jgi:hypothetical protein
MQNLYWYMLPYDDLSGGYQETDYIVCVAVTAGHIKILARKDDNSRRRCPIHEWRKNQPNIKLFY